MDNVTHTLAAVAIAKTRVGRLSRLALPALVVSANLPDFDSLVRFFGGLPTYLTYHRGITHSLPGVMIQAPLLATIFWAIGRLLYRKSATADTARPAGPRTSWPGLFVAVSCGLLTQPLFDWFNTYGLRFWLPFDDTWYYGDLAFIVDPWLWLLFGGAACLAGGRSRGGSVAYALVAVLGGLFLLMVADLGVPAPPAALQAAWLAAVVAIAIGRWRGLGRRHPNRLVAAAGILAAVYVGGLAWAGRASWARHQAQLVEQLPPGETVARHMCSPQPANPLAWMLVARTEAAVYLQPVDLLGHVGPLTRLPHNLDQPLVQAALNTPAGRAWRDFARFPVARVRAHASSPRVLLLDARYPVEPAERNWCRMTIELPAGRIVPRSAGRPTRE